MKCGEVERPQPFQGLTMGSSSLHAPGKNNLRAMCWGQIEGQSLLGIHFLAKAIGVNCLGLQGARESPDAEVLVMCLVEELGRS